jgi:predicted nucleic acid-binding protein
VTYLLDTVVLSELRKRQRDPRLVAWLRGTRQVDLYLSVVTIGEVEKGIAKQQRRDPEFAGRLTSWLDDVLRHYVSRILPVDLNVARRWDASPMRTAMPASTS